MRRFLRSRWFQGGVALVLLAMLYRAADWQRVSAAVAELRPGYLAAALALFVPQTLVSAWRWRYLVSRSSPIGYFEALRQTLAAASLNLVVPGKLGDLSKAAMLPPTPDATRASLARLVVVEKGADVAALVAVAVAGWFGGASPLLLVATLGLTVAIRVAAPDQANLGRGAVVAGMSSLLWTLHVMQIEWFLYAADVDVASAVALARVPWAIFSGLLPISLWGVGTRDAALVWLFADVAPPATMAVVGMLTALRYLVPGACGIAIVGRYLRPSEGSVPSGRIERAASRLRRTQRDVATT